MIYKLVHFIAVVLLSFILYSCIKKDDDLASQDCPANCTVITGRFVTDAGQTGIGGIPLTVEWVQRAGIIGGQIRRKATTSTKANGSYELRFLLRDDELLDGYFRITYSADSKRFITEKNSVAYSSYELTRDTVVVSNWLLPRKAFLRLELPGSAPTVPNDYFASTVSFINGSFTSIGQVGNYGIVCTWAGTTKVFDIEVAANQRVVIENRRVKNGIRVIDTDTLQLTPGSRSTYRTAF